MNRRGRRNVVNNNKVGNEIFYVNPLFILMNTPQHLPMGPCPEGLAAVVYDNPCCMRELFCSNQSVTIHQWKNSKKIVTTRRLSMVSTQKQ
jgi:hypothetical protein